MVQFCFSIVGHKKRSATQQRHWGSVCVMTGEKSKEEWTSDPLVPKFQHRRDLPIATDMLMWRLKPVMNIHVSTAMDINLGLSRILICTKCLPCSNCVICEATSAGAMFWDLISRQMCAHEGSVCEWEWNVWDSTKKSTWECGIQQRSLHLAGWL